MTRKVMILNLNCSSPRVFRRLRPSALTGTRLRRALLHQIFQDFWFLEDSTPGCDLCAYEASLKYSGATHEDWT